MKPKLTSAIVMTIAIAFSIVTVPAYADGPQEAHEELRRQIFEVPLPLDSVWDVAVSDNTVLAVGFEYENVVGEFAMDPSVEDETLRDRFDQTTTDLYGAQPLITHLLKQEGQPDTRISSPSDRSSIARLPSAKVASMTPSSSSDSGSISPQVAESWAPNYVHVRMYESSAGHNIVNELEWSGSEGRNPTSFAPGWGLEVETNAIGDFLAVGTRPACVGLIADPDYDYWVGRGHNEQVRSWALEQVDGSATGQVEPYFDWENTFDQCNRMSMAVGIRYPDKLYAQEWSDDSYWFVRTRIVADPGNESTSVMEGQLDTVTDDCFGVGVSSACMGLKTDQDYPGAEDYSLVFNESRGFEAPGCVTSSVGQDPQRYTEGCGAP